MPDKYQNILIYVPQPPFVLLCGPFCVAMRTTLMGLHKGKCLLRTTGVCPTRRTMAQAVEQWVFICARFIQNKTLERVENF